MAYELIELHNTCVIVEFMAPKRCLRQVNNTKGSGIGSSDATAKALENMAAMQQ